MEWNQWPESRGMGGRDRLEFAIASARWSFDDMTLPNFAQYSSCLAVDLFSIRASGSACSASLESILKDTVALEHLWLMQISPKVA